MDPQFTFPPRPRPRHPPVSNDNSQPTQSRESNALRASVLDAALELGIGANSTVANWMFNNALEEEDEEVGFISYRSRVLPIYEPSVGVLRRANLPRVPNYPH